MQRYVVENVLLIRKQKPEWMAGLLNGLGGKVENGEMPAHAMVREFQEEAGVRVPDWQWRWFCGIGGHNTDGEAFHCDFFWSISDLAACKSQEREQLEVSGISILYLHKTVPNLKWLLPLAIDCAVNPHGPITVNAIYGR